MGHATWPTVRPFSPTGDDEEATREFHNFLRAAGYVIPYDIEWYEDDPLQKLTDWEEKYRHES